jgi:hypothetical protein
MDERYMILCNVAPLYPVYISLILNLREIIFFADIPNVSDKDFSITLNAYFNVKWKGRSLRKGFQISSD